MVRQVFRLAGREMENLTASPNSIRRTRKGPGRGARFALAAAASRAALALEPVVYEGGKFWARTQDAANGL